MEREDLPTLEQAIARYPLRLPHPASATVLDGSSPQGLSSSARARFFPLFDQPSAGTITSLLSAPTVPAVPAGVKAALTEAQWRDQFSPFRVVSEARVRDSLYFREETSATTHHISSATDTDVGAPNDGCVPQWTWSDRACHYTRVARKVTKTRTKDARGAADQRVDDDRASRHTTTVPSPCEPPVQKRRRVSETRAASPQRHDTATGAVALASRVDENDDLLSLLLGGENERSTNRTPRQNAEEAIRCEPTGTARPLPPVGRSSSASPRRTTFRYCSSNARTTPSTSPARAPPPAPMVGTDAHTPTSRAASPPPPPPSPPPSPPRPTRRERRVPPFDTFVAMAQQEEGASATTPDLTATALKRLAKAAEAEQQEAMKAVTWRLLVDHRERVKGTNAQMIAALERQHVPCAPCVLPCGDFVVSVACDDANAADPDRTADVQAIRAATDAVHDVGPDALASASTSAAFSHVCPVVVERKTADDLDASIKGSRYLEQRRLLAHSPFTHVIWLVEGEPRLGTRFGARGGGAGGGTCTPSSRSPSPPPASLSASTTLVSQNRPGSPAAVEDVHRVSPKAAHTGRERLGASEVEQRLDAACASLAVLDADAMGCDGSGGFTVVRTRDVHESIAFLKQLALTYVRDIAVRGDHRRRGSDSAVSRTDAAAAAKRPWMLETEPVFREVRCLQRHLRAQTAFPRVLMCIRGCAAPLALWVTMKYGTLRGLWRLVHTRGRAAVDEDGEVQQLPIAQKKVLVLLTEFLLATEYF